MRSTDLFLIRAGWEVLGFHQCICALLCVLLASVISLFPHSLFLISSPFSLNPLLSSILQDFERFGLLTKPLPKICWQVVVEEILFHISFCWRCPTWSLNRSLTCNKPTHYPLAYDVLLNYSWQIAHIYIHNWSLQPFSQDYWPSFSHNLCCVC